jgi:phosphatidylglycerophosphate synthase
MMIKRAFISVPENNTWINKKKLGLTVKERMIYSLFYGGIKVIYADLDSCSRVFKDKKLKGLKLSPLKDGVKDSQTLIFDTPCIFNSIFIKELLEKKTHEEDFSLKLLYQNFLKKNKNRRIVCVPIESEKEFLMADSKLRRSLVKEHDTLLARLFNRAISTRVTVFFAKYIPWLMPNMVSFFCLFLGLFANILLISTTSYKAGIIAGVSLYIMSLLDGVDGELARIKYQFSSFGLWLDNVTDEFINILTIIGTGIYAYHITGQIIFIFLSSMAFTLVCIGKILQYLSIYFKIESEDISQFSLPQFNSRFLEVVVTFLEGIPRADMMRFMLMICAVFAVIPFYSYGISLFSVVFFIGVCISIIQKLIKR